MARKYLGVALLLAAASLFAPPLNAHASQTHRPLKVKCKVKHCAIRVVGFGNLKIKTFPDQDPRFAFLTGPHFRIDYAYTCKGVAQPNFSITLWAYYGNRWQYDLVISETQDKNKSSTLVDQPSGLRWYPEVSSNCSWWFRVVKESLNSDERQSKELHR